MNIIGLVLGTVMAVLLVIGCIQMAWQRFLWFLIRHRSRR